MPVRPAVLIPFVKRRHLYSQRLLYKHKFLTKAEEVDMGDQSGASGRNLSLLCFQV